jgi:lysophospholipase L1-like esterase
MARLVALVVVAFAVVNALVAMAVRRTGLAERPIDVQTRGLYEVRLGQLERAALLGDSLAFGAHLAEKHGKGWPALSLAGQLEQRLHTPVLNLGINGVLFKELGCVVHDVLARKPELLFVNVSPRPFAADFADDPQASARPFVCPDESVAGHVAAGLRALVPVLRDRDLLQLGWLGDTPRGALRAAISKPFEAPPPPAADAEEDEDDAFVAGLMWRFKAAQRLNSIDVRDTHPQARELARLLAELRAASTRVLVFYLHEDESALAGQLDVPHFHAQQASFAALVARGLGTAPRARFVEVDASELAGEYVDHVHLTARGYARLAERLTAAVPGGARGAAH